MTLAIVLPLKGSDLTLATAGQQQQADHRRRQGRDGTLRGQRRAQTTGLADGKEPLPPSPTVAPEARARIAVLWPMAVDLRLAQNQGQDRKRAVRRGRCRMQGGKPALHLPARDVGDGTPPEEGHDLVAEIGLIDDNRPRLPGTPMAAEDFFGDRLEGGRLVADRWRFGWGVHHGQLRGRGLAGVGIGESVR